MKKLLVFLGLMVTGSVSGQFFSSPPTIDGTVDADYVTSGSWSMGWDDTYLYLNYTGGATTEPVIFYIDVDPQTPVSGGTNSNGSLVGQSNWDITPTLPFRADFMIYWESNYAEYRTDNGSGGWSTNTTITTTDRSNSGSTVREIRLSWANMGLGSRPSAFNWCGYANSRANPGFIYNEVPSDNPDGALGSPRLNYYYSVTNTTNSGTTSPFGQKSLEHRGSGDFFIVGANTLFDITNNSGNTTDEIILENIGSNFTLEMNGTAYLAGGIVVNAGETFQINSGGGVALEANGFIANNSSNVVYNSTNTTLTYSNSGTYTTSGEWPLGDPPANIVVDDNTAITLTGTRVTSGNFTVESGSSAEVEATASMEVAGTLTNDGTITMRSTYSSATTSNTASLLQGASSSLAGSGTFNIERNTGDVADHNRFQYWSSPVTSTTMTTVFTGTNSSDHYTYDEATDGWVSATTMTPGRGYATTPTTGNTTTFNETRTFSGTINNGNVNVSLNSPAASDFVLVGNPYPSAITSATFVSDNSNITGSLYFWNQATPPTGFNGSGNNNTGDYATWNGVGSASGGNGGVSPDDYIQSCQGFFVQLTGTPGTQITFNNAQRTSGNNSQFFKTTTETRERFWVNLYNDQGAFNQILVGLLDDATFGYDRIYDAYKFKGSSDLAFYSVDHGNDYAIQGLPKLDLNNNMHTVALGVDAWQSGRYTIALDSLNNWPSARAIILTDSALGQTVDLMQQDYDFVVNQTGEIRNRFYISYSDQTVNLPKLTRDEQFFAFQRGQELILDGSELNSAFSQVELYNLSGQLVKSILNADHQAELTMNVGDLSQGVYILKVKSGKQTFNQKISIK